MRPRTPLLIATVAAVTVALVPAQAAAAPAAPAEAPTAAPTATSATPGFVAPLNLDLARAHLDAADRARLDAITATLPADWQERLARFRAELGIEPSPVEQAVARAIDPSQYECQPTAFSDYTSTLLADVDLGTLLTLLILGVLDYPTYDALLFGTARDKDYGIPHQYKTPVTQTVRKSQKFWDVDLSDVQTLAMRNDMLADHARMARVIGVLFPADTPEDSASTATILMDMIRTAPGLDGGRNPIFTLNAFAFTAEGETDPIFQGLPDKVIFGEGLGVALGELGLGGTGAKAVVAHEMAHQVQFEQGYFDSPLTGPEATRRTELMADAFGTYFVAHKRGFGFTGESLRTATQAFYEVGDCSFTSNGHHGTPNQRRAASEWGADQATTRPPFPVWPSDTLYAAFERQLPTFLLPDAAQAPAA
ncbi:hypothetical protein BLA60_16065 [Actinophytocola xinjiangensis]|uniref:Uncharacterized protein n=1 Tax=Actinophytocola xinjiangensis TaxID=485602 RepID=A0A7Z0WNA0_9PSEU|nr:hypothetical protein [Actinophytocola xinjiangensis]OLF10677.1 hypothetical protein BLA60_16065 [Actinophytocola xinjiangensis]